MKRFFAVFLIFVLCISFAVSALAVEPDELVELTYWEWCMHYSVCDCADHQSEYIGIKSYSAGHDEVRPVLIPYSEYVEAFPGRVDYPSERNFEIGLEKELYGKDSNDSEKYFDSDSFSSRYSNLNLGNVLVDYISQEAIKNIAEARQADAMDSENESVDVSLASVPDDSSNVALLSANPVPDSGSSYTQPTLVATEYAPDAESGTLLSVLYQLLGKPVKSYTYSYQNSYQNGYTVYKLELLDYDINWLASFFLLCLVIFCVFKAGGVLLSKL